MIDAANDTPFGLSAYFYTRDLGRAWRVAEALESGMVGINEGIISTEACGDGAKGFFIGDQHGRRGVREHGRLVKRAAEREACRPSEPSHLC